jgi:hypothetical protein
LGAARFALIGFPHRYGVPGVAAWHGGDLYQIVPTGTDASRNHCERSEAIDRVFGDMDCFS